MSDAIERLNVALEGRYAIQRELGEGGMATVYLALDLGHDRQVAVKVLKPDLTTASEAKRFIREIRVTAQLNHPHILPLLDSGESDGLSYYVTPYIEGGSLRDRLLRDKQLPLQDAFRIAQQVAEALRATHVEGVIHRDIKPGNIFLRESDALVADFGIARALDEVSDDKLTKTGVSIGTVGYMSPEQATGQRNLDQTSDLYSLGCVLFEMLVGEPPFTGPTSQIVIARQIGTPPPRIVPLRDTVPDAVDDVVTRALARMPADRFRCASDFAEALRAASESESSRPRVARPLAVRIAISIGALALAATTAWFSGVGLGLGDVWPFRLGGVLPDTTQYVVIPTGQDIALADVVPIHLLLQDALRRWEGIAVVDGAGSEVAGPAGSSSTDLTVDWFRRVARDVGAGRIVTAEARLMGDSVRVEARLLDPESSVEPLARLAFMIRPDGSGSQERVARAVESLLFRSISPSATPLIEHTNSLAAARQFLIGDAARTRWSLTEAARHLAEATVHDPSFDLALFWKAQVISWQAPPNREWEVDARRALQGADGLPPRERSLATALAAMADERYPEACSIYEQLREQDQTDFAALFGLGECRRLDPIVLPDPRSRTLWSFRASGHAAATAYRRAFELLPSSFLDFGAESPALIPRLFYATRGNYRQGVSPAPGSMVFRGYGEWQGDSLAFVPVSREAAANFGLGLGPGNRMEALLQQRRTFLGVANGLSDAFPTSIGARHMLALARELVGEASALDTYREARELAEPGFRAEIGIAEVVLQVRSSMPGDEDGLRAAVALGVSILSEATGGRLDAPRELAELAVLLGQPNRAARMSRAAVDGAGLLGVIPMEVSRETGALLAFSAVGAPVDSIRTVEARALRLINQSVPGSDVRTVLRSVLEQPSFLAFPADTLEFLDDLTLPQGREARAIASLAAGDAEEAVRVLGDPFSEVGWDVMLARANILIAAGRDSIGLDLLRSHLGSLGEADPAEVRGVPRLGGLARAVLLRAQLEYATGSYEAAAEWARAAEILWGAGESAVMPVLERMRSIARSPERD